MKVYIYVLTEPDGHTVRYVGKSNEFRIKKRLIEHCRLSQLKKNSHKNNWIRSLLNQNERPVFKIIEECSEFDFQEREKYWVKYYKDKGCDLTNGTVGGEGAIRIPNRVISEEQKRKIGETWKKHPKFLEICSEGGRKSRGIKRNLSFKQSSNSVGVSKTKRGKWRAYASRGGKFLFFGYFNTEEEAIKIRKQKLIDLNLS
jgi:hypothetical protein